MTTTDRFDSQPEIHYGSRGEDIAYRIGDNKIEVGFTYINGSRIYTESLDRWTGGIALNEQEKERVFDDIVAFVRKTGDKPIVVINTDDPSRMLWDRLCATHQVAVKGIEYTSDEEQHQSSRDMYLGILQAGKGLVIDGTDIRTERELDDALRKYRKKRRP